MYLPIAQTPANTSPCTPLGTHLQWKDFSRIKPRHCKPCSAKDEGIQVDHGSRSNPPLLLICGIIQPTTSQATGQKHSNGLSCCSPPQCPATPDAVQCEDTDECRQGVEDVVQPGNPEDLLRIKACNLENNCPCLSPLPVLHIWIGDILGAYMVTPAIPVQLCRICSHMTS